MNQIWFSTQRCCWLSFNCEALITFAKLIAFKLILKIRSLLREVDVVAVFGPVGLTALVQNSGCS